MTKASLKSEKVKIKPKELEKIVVELAKKGEKPVKIGLILRDKYGIPKAKLLGKKITQILKENNIEYETPKQKVELRIEKIKKHLEKNKHDYPAKRSLTKKLWDLYHLKSKK